MDEKKTFFASLEPKSAAIVGAVAGFLILGTIGFFIMLGMNLKGGNTTVNAKDANATVAQTQDNTPTATPEVKKTNKPVVELFVMSYCPYGLQMEKAYLPAWELLKDKADISLKFVSYAMHGQKELEENTRQYCLAKNFSNKIISYLICFTGKDNYKGCLAKVGVTEGQLAGCVNATNKQYQIIDKFNDKSTWLSGNYPVYPVNEDLNTKYGVQGSPTLVINGAQTEGVNRTPEAVKQAICAAFNTAPAECATKLSEASPVPGFGAGTNGGNTAGAACGN